MSAMLAFCIIPAAGAAQSYQAEDAKNASNDSFAIISDHSAYPVSGDNAVKHLDGSRLNVDVDAAFSSVTVYAKSYNPTKVRVFVDGERYGADKIVAGSEMYAYKFDGADAPAGEHRVSVKMVEGDNLKVDRVQVR